MPLYAVINGRGEERLHPDYGETVDGVLAAAEAEAGSLVGSAAPQTAPGEVWLRTFDGGAVRMSVVTEIRLHPEVFAEATE